MEVNQESFEAGETLELNITVTPGAAPPSVDAYVLLEQPSGGLLYLQADGELTLSPSPMFSGWMPVATSFVGLSETIPGSWPPGTYVWHTRLYEPGTFDLVAGVSAAAFEANIQ